MTVHSFEVLVVGAGPAGLAAATAAARAGKRVAVLDDNPQTGGQIWRAGSGVSAKDAARERAVQAFAASGAAFFAGRQVVDAPRSQQLQIWNSEAQSSEVFAYERLVLATGARERFLPFPGWTLQGVFGAGGLQALVRGGYDVRGKRVVVAGTGPLLLAVAAHLQQDGAKIVALVEQAPLSRLATFATRLLLRPGKIWQGLRLRLQLAGVRYRTGCWPLATEGTTTLTGVRLTDGSRTWVEACDLLACGFHLVPNTELASLLGCRVNPIGVAVDAQQQTSVAGIYCVGEATGIAGVDAAQIEGEIAGLAAAGSFDAAARLHARRDAEANFGRAMSRAFALRPELRTLATPDTLVCRCEDVRFGELHTHAMPHNGWTEAKLQTRCGMGACQGRICGPALEFLFGWRNGSIRPPLYPVPLAAMCSASPVQENLNPLQLQEISQ